MTEAEKLSQLCERLGASPAQAKTMAAQLLKRADQIAAGRAVTREVALRDLLDMVVKGRAGLVPEGFALPVSPPRAADASP